MNDSSRNGASQSELRRSSAATRVQSLIEQLLVHPAIKGDTWSAWAFALGMGEQSSPELEARILSGLALFRRQVDSMLESATRAGVPDPLMHGVLASMRAISAAGSMPASWEQVRQNISPEVRARLQWAAFALAGDEERLSDEEILGLKAEVAELKAVLAEGTLSSFLESYIRRSLDQLHEALDQYCIAGASQIAVTVHAIRGEGLSSVDEIIREMKSTGPEGHASALVSKFGKVVKRATDAAETAGKLHKGMSAVRAAIEAGQEGVTWVTNALPFFD